MVESGKKLVELPKRVIKYGEAVVLLLVGTDKRQKKDIRDASHDWESFREDAEQAMKYWHNYLDALE